MMNTSTLARLYRIRRRKGLHEAETRIVDMDIDDTVMIADVAISIVEASDCSPWDIKLGENRRPPTSLGHVWVTSGSGFVRLSWATYSVVRMLSEWRVGKEIVTLSNHRHIVFAVALHPSGDPSRSALSSPAHRSAFK